MKILAFEYACAGGPGSEPFLDEGRRMLTALLEDLARSGAGRIATLVSPSLETSGLTADEFVEVDGDFSAAAEREMKNADAIWITAPETDGILRLLTDTAWKTGKKVIGSSPGAVEFCSDKLSLARLLSETVPMPHTRLYSCGGGFDDFPCVVKPVDGAGCEDVYFIENQQALERLDLDRRKFIIQPYLRGEKLSAGIFSRAGDPFLLGVCRQNMEMGFRVRLKDLAGPLDYSRTGKLLEMVETVLRIIPGLDGYWGVDFIDSNGELSLVEINPRLTTSYPIYSASCGFNIASLAVSRACKVS